VVEQETDIGSTDINPFIQVASSDGHHEPVPNVEIVTPSFLEMDEVAIQEESDPTLKLENPFVDSHQIVEEPFHNSLENFPTEVPEAQFSDTPADPAAIITPEDLPLAVDSPLDVSAAPVLDESAEPNLKLEDPSVNPYLVDDVPISHEAVAPIPEGPSPYLFVPISGEVEPTQKLEDPSVDPAIVSVPISDEAVAPLVEDHFAHPAAVLAPISDDVAEPEQKLEDPSIDVRVVAVPISDEAVAPIAEDPSIDSAIISAPIADEAVAPIVEEPFVDPAIAFVPISEEPVAPIAEDPSINPSIVSVPIADEAVAPIVEDPSFDPAPISDEFTPIVEVPSADPVLLVDSAPISDQVEITQKIEEPLVETEQVSVLEDSSAAVKVQAEDASVAAQQDLPPSPPPVFISSVSPATLPILIATLAPAAIEPVIPVGSPVLESLEKVAAIPAALNNAYPVGQSKATAVKQPAAVYSKVPTAAPITKLRVQYKYQPIVQSSSPRPSLAYGPPRSPTNTIAQSSHAGGLSSLPIRPFGSSPKPRQLGFPPVSSTRENILLEVNWDGKLGRPYRQAKLH
jgi:hypothetical protein